MEASRLRRPTLAQALWFALLALCLYANYAKLVRPTPFAERPYLRGYDPNHYFNWGRSLVVDGDWDFTNDLQFLAYLKPGPPESAAQRTYLLERVRTPLGRVPNLYAAGTGLLAAPLLLAARAWCGPGSSPFSGAYMLAFLWTQVLAGFLGIALAYRFVARFYGKRLALAASFLGIPALSIGYYIWCDPGMSHAAGFACVTAFVIAAQRWKESVEAAVTEERGVGETARYAALMGLFFGLACMVRLTSVAALLIPCVLWVTASCWSRQRRPWSRPGLLSASLSAAAAGTLIGLLPQMIAWKQVYGSWLMDTYAPFGGFQTWPVHAPSVLFSWKNGLFSWTPMAAVAVAGLALAARAMPMAAAGCAALLAVLAIHGRWDEYWLGYSFGMRGFADFSVFFLLGIAEALRRLGTARSVSKATRVFAWGALGLIVVWTVFAAVAVRAGVMTTLEPPNPAAALSRPEQLVWGFRNEFSLVHQVLHPKQPLCLPASRDKLDFPLEPAEKAGH